MADKWAAEPWRIAEGECFIKSEEGWGSIVDSQDWYIAKLEDSLDPQANAERIVACVNALRGLEPSGVVGAIEALELCLSVLRRAPDGDAPELAEARQRAEAALRSVGRPSEAAG